MCRKHIKENVMFLLLIHLFIYSTNDVEHLHVIGIVLIIIQSLPFKELDD